MARVAACIAERGMPATLMAPARYEGYVDGTKAMFTSIGADDVFESVFNGREIWDARSGLKASWRYYGAAMSASLAKLRATSQPDATALVSSSFAVGARMAEELDGYLNTTVHLSPGVIFSAAAPPAWPAFSIPEFLPPIVKAGLVRMAERFATDPVIGAHVNPTLRDSGRPARRRLFSEWIHSPRRVMYAFPEWFAKAAIDWPAQGVFAGFPQGTAQEQAIAPHLVEWIDGSDAPLIVITAGTAVEGRPAWVRAALQGARACGARVVLIEPEPVEMQAVTRDVISVPFVSFRQLLPKARLILHHGGIGTFVQALRSATPQIMVPTAHDQFDNAARAVSLGLATGTSPRELSAAAHKVIEHALADSSKVEKAVTIHDYPSLCDDGADVIAQRVIAEAVGRRECSAQPALSPAHADEIIKLQP